MEPKSAHLRQKCSSISTSSRRRKVTVIDSDAYAVPKVHLSQQQPSCRRRKRRRIVMLVINTACNCLLVQSPLSILWSWVWSNNMQWATAQSNNISLRISLSSSFSTDFPSSYFSPSKSSPSTKNNDIHMPKPQYYNVTSQPTTTFYPTKLIPSPRPTRPPTARPTKSFKPSNSPSLTSRPTITPSPTAAPTSRPSLTRDPTLGPSIFPSFGPSFTPSTRPTITLTQLNQTGLNMLLEDVQQQNWSRSDVAIWADTTSFHVQSFWDNFSFSPYYVGLVTTRVISTTRLAPQRRLYGDAVASAPSPSAASTSPTPSLSNSTLIRPLLIVYNQSVMYGETETPINSIYLPTDEKLFILPFTIDQRSYTETLATQLNLTQSIFLVSTTIASLSPTAAPTFVYQEQQQQDRNIILITVIITGVSLLVAGSYIFYLKRKEDLDPVEGPIRFDDYTEGDDDCYGQEQRLERTGNTILPPPFQTFTTGVAISAISPAEPADPVSSKSLGTTTSSVVTAAVPPPPLSGHQPRRYSAESDTNLSVYYDSRTSATVAAAVAASALGTDSDLDSVELEQKIDLPNILMHRDEISVPTSAVAGRGAMYLHNNLYPTISTLPISVISGEGGSGSGSTVPGQAVFRGVAERRESEPDELLANDIYSVYPHRPRLSDSDLLDPASSSSLLLTTTAVPPLHSQASGIAGTPPPLTEEGDDYDDDEDDDNDGDDAPPHLMSGFQMTIEDLDDM